MDVHFAFILQDMQVKKLSFYKNEYRMNTNYSNSQINKMNESNMNECRMDTND